MNITEFVRMKNYWLKVNKTKVFVDSVNHWDLNVTQWFIILAESFLPGACYHLNEVYFLKLKSLNNKQRAIQLTNDSKQKT